MNFQKHIFDKISEIRKLTDKNINVINDAFEITHYYDSLTNTEEEALIYYNPQVFINFYQKFSEALEYIENSFDK